MEQEIEKIIVGPMIILSTAQIFILLFVPFAYNIIIGWIALIWIGQYRTTIITLAVLAIWLEYLTTAIFYPEKQMVKQKDKSMKLIITKPQKLKRNRLIGAINGIIGGGMGVTAMSLFAWLIYEPGFTILAAGFYICITIYGLYGLLGIISLPVILITMRKRKDEKPVEMEKENAENIQKNTE